MVWLKNRQFEINCRRKKMKRNNTQSLKEVLKEYMDNMHIRTKLKESRLKDQWEQLLGKNAASLTKKLEIRNKVLYVTLDSSVLRNELLMMREKLIFRINELAGEEIVNKIILK
jgi:predicted nucleic acid-binding Zn ribbon protein